MSTGVPTDRRSAPLRLYHHDPRAPFLDPADGAITRKAPKPLGHADAHWARHFERRDSQHSELRLYFRGRAPKSGQPPRVAAERSRVRSELHETVSRLIRWMLSHCDVRTRWVGKFDGAGVRPYPLTEIAEALRRPGEKRIPLSTLCRAIGRVLAAGYIWRWQGRDREVDADGVEYFTGKTAVLRLTERFFRVSGGAWAVRERWLAKMDNRAARRRVDAPLDDFQAFLAKFERKHPHLRTFEGHRKAREAFARFERMRAAARAAKPPPK